MGWFSAEHWEWTIFILWNPLKATSLRSDLSICYSVLSKRLFAHTRASEFSLSHDHLSWTRYHHPQQQWTSDTCLCHYSLQSVGIHFEWFMEDTILRLFDAYSCISCIMHFSAPHSKYCIWNSTKVHSLSTRHDLEVVWCIFELILPIGMRCKRLGAAVPLMTHRVLWTVPAVELCNFDALFSLR